MPIGLSDILAVVKGAYDQFQQAAENSQACQETVKRLDVIFAIADELNPRIMRSKACQLALIELNNCGQSAAALAKHFSEKGKIIALLRAGKYEKEFEAINLRLDQVIAGLTLALGVSTREHLSKVEGLSEEQSNLIQTVLKRQEDLIRQLQEQEEKAEQARHGLVNEQKIGESVTAGQAIVQDVGGMVGVAQKDLAQILEDRQRQREHIQKMGGLRVTQDIGAKANLQGGAQQAYHTVRFASDSPVNSQASFPGQKLLESQEAEEIIYTPLTVTQFSIEALLEALCELEAKKATLLKRQKQGASSSRFNEELSVLSQQIAVIENRLYDPSWDGETSALQNKESLISPKR